MYNSPRPMTQNHCVILCLARNFSGFSSKNEAQRFLSKCHCKLLLKVCCSNIFLFSYLICCSMFYSLLNNIRHFTRFLLSPIAERCAFCSIADRRRTIALPDERRTKRGQCLSIAAKVQNNINTSNIFASFFWENICYLTPLLSRVLNK